MIGLAVPATTTRWSQATGQRVTHLSITCRQIGLRGGALLRPLGSPAEVAEFGADVFQTRLVFADWPITTEDMPVKVDDHLLVGASDYAIVGVKHVANSHMQIYVRIESPA